MYIYLITIDFYFVNAIIDRLAVLYQTMKHRLDDPEYIVECVHYHRGFLIWNERPRNHFRSLSIRDRWNKEHAGRMARKHDFPDPTILLSGHKFRESTLTYLLHLANTENYQYVKFEGDFGVHLPYGQKDGELLYTTRVSHHNNILCDNRIENLYLGPLVHREPYTFPRETRFQYREEPEFARWVVYSLHRGKPCQIMGYTLKESQAKDLYHECRRIYGQ